MIKQEFESITAELDSMRKQRDDYESKGAPQWHIHHERMLIVHVLVASQVNELNIIRRSLYDLEAQHGKVRQQYEEELNRLRSELAALPPKNNLTQPPLPNPPPSGLYVTQPPPPMAPAESLPVFAPQSSTGTFHSRERELNREKLRDRPMTVDRDARELEHKENSKERDFERDLDRSADYRDAKRMKTERIKNDRPGECRIMVQRLSTSPDTCLGRRPLQPLNSSKLHSQTTPCPATIPSSWRMLVPGTANDG